MATPDYVFCFGQGASDQPKSGWSLDQGVDITANGEEKLLAVGNGKYFIGTISGFGPDITVLQLDKPFNGHNFVYYGHVGPSDYSRAARSAGANGVTVKAGEILGVVGSGIVGLSTGPHLEIGWATDKSGMPAGRNTAASFESFLADLSSGRVPTPGGGNTTGHTAEQLAVSQGMTGHFQMAGIFDAAESQGLKGDRGMMNDLPLFPFIQELAGASLREIMSLPDGRFYAFYPDYFGSLGKHAYWQIADVEIIDGRIDLSDDELRTHVFVVGDVTGDPDHQINIDDKITTGGVISLFTAFSADFLNGEPNGGTSKSYPNKPTFKNNRNGVLQFLGKYGARPMYVEEPLIRAPIYEAFRAYQLFCLQWAKQFKTTFEFTFMPELYPGGIVAFPEHGLQCYVQSVTHNCSYENGFTTHAELIAPSSMKTDDGTPADPDKLWVHAGMIRALNNDEVANFNPTTLPLEKNKSKWKPASF